MYTEKAKREVVFSADEVERLVPLIRVHAATGEAGDGVVFVSPVDYALKISTGVEGRAALR